MQPAGMHPSVMMASTSAPQAVPQPPTPIKHPSVSAALGMKLMLPHVQLNLMTAENALELFCIRDNYFYDTSCCNQQIIMQTQQIAMQTQQPRHTPEMMEQMKQMPGVQYVLHHASPPVFVIRKQYRVCDQLRNEVIPLAYYYVVNGAIYQAPDLYTLTESRIAGAVDSLRQALDKCVSYSRFSVAKGYHWQFTDDKGHLIGVGAGAKDKDKDDEENDPLEARSTHFQRTRSEMLIRHLLHEYPPPEESALRVDLGSGGSTAQPAADGTGAMEVDPAQNGGEDQAAASSQQPASNAPQQSSSSVPQQQSVGEVGTPAAVDSNMSS